MRFKKGTGPARLFGVTPYTLIAMMVADEVWRDLGVEQGAYVTSVSDGAHSDGSRHYTGNAVDLRIWNLLPAPFDGDFDRADLRAAANHAAAELRDRLTEEYRVIVERTHIHVQYSPGR